MATGIEYLNGPEKRALDITGSLLMLAPATVITTMSAMALRQEVGGLRNLLFLQSRDMGGKRLTVPKLRTIHPNHTEGKPMVHYGSLDPRAGTVGRFIREMGFDEMPQVGSVLRGHMSLVGPRPRPDFEIEEYRKSDPVLFDEWYDACAEIRPGLFGLSQLMRHSHVDNTGDEIRTRSMLMELDYAQTATLGTDLRILAETTPALMVAAVNAYSEAKPN